MANSSKKYPVKGLSRHGKRWRWEKTINGRRIRHSFDAPNEAEAIAWVMRMEQRADLVEAGAWDHEVGSYIKEKTAAGELSVNYASSRGLILRKEGAAAGFGKPEEMTTARMQCWYDEREKEGALSRVSLNHYLKHFRCFADWLVSKNMLLENPVSFVKALPDPDNTRETFLTADEVGRLLEASRAEHVEWNKRFPRRLEKTPILELFLLLACECGMRRGEIDAARAQWVDMERGVIVIPKEDRYEGRVWTRKGRTRSRRQAVIPMVASLKAWFEEHGIPSPYLLKPEKGWGKSKYRYEVAGKVNRFLEKNGFGHVTIHDMRRSFATNRVSAGISIEKVANWMAIDYQTAWKRYARFIPVDGEIERGAAVAQIAEGEESPAPKQGGSLKERLASLKELFDEGLITELEFSEKKAEILSDL